MFQVAKAVRFSPLSRSRNLSLFPTAKSIIPSHKCTNDLGENRKGPVTIELKIVEEGLAVTHLAKTSYYILLSASALMEISSLWR